MSIFTRISQESRISHWFREFLRRASITQKLLFIVMVPTLVSLLLACALLFVFTAVLIRQWLLSDMNSIASITALQLGEAYQQQSQFRVQAPVQRGAAARPMRPAPPENSGDKPAAPRTQARPGQGAILLDAVFESGGTWAPGKAERTLHLLDADDRIRAAALYDSNGDVVAQYSQGRQPVTLPEGSPPNYATSWFEGGALHLYRPLDALAGGEYGMIGVLYMRVDAGLAAFRIAFLGLAVLLIIALCAVLSYLLSMRLQHIIAAPIRHLALLAGIISEERDYSIRAVRETDDEVGHLVDEFNEMLARIEAHRHALVAAHDELEVRVEARTHELREETEQHKETAADLRREVLVRQEAETKLKQATREAEAASRAKGEFLANMSHEIRTPMSGVIGMTELLCGTELSAAQRKYADTIRRSGQALLKILNEVLDYSKVEAGQLELEEEPFDLHAVCEDVIELMAPRSQEKRLALILRYAPDVPRWLAGDAGRLGQVLTNLVANAVKFTHHGHVLLDVSHAGAREGAAALRIAVEDTGIGASKEKLNKIFKQYEQADRSVSKLYGGTGLGLAISKQLVELMGGSIKARSCEGLGSRFEISVSLPIADGPRPQLVPEPVLVGAALLVVDGDRVGREARLEQLRSWGVAAEGAGTTAEALRRSSEAEAAGTPFSLVLVDDQVEAIRPDSLARELRAGRDEKAGPHLALLASHGVRGDADVMRAQGYAVYLTKPVREAELHDALAALCSGEAASAQLITRHSLAERHPGDTDARFGPGFAAEATVLVADDSHVNQEVAKEILESFGCTVTLVTDGMDAVNMTKSMDFDLIFMDCQMPNMDGFTATKWIRSLEGAAGRTPVVAMTAMAMDGDREQCLAAGMDDYISKPINPEAFARQLRKWLPFGRISDSVSARGTVPEVPKPVIPPPRPEDSDAAPQVFDVARALWVTGGNRPLLKRATEIFMRHMPERFVLLGTEVENRNASEVQRLAHSIKGASASVGGEKVRAAALALEYAAREGKADAFAGMFATLQQEYKELAEALDAFEAEEGADALAREAAES